MSSDQCLLRMNYKRLFGKHSMYPLSNCIILYCVLILFVIYIAVPLTKIVKNNAGSIATTKILKRLHVCIDFTAFALVQ